MSDLEDIIEANAQKPQSATIAGNTVTQHSLQDQIAADEYLENKRATAGAKRGMLFTRLKPGGPV